MQRTKNLKRWAKKLLSAALTLSMMLAALPALPVAAADLQPENPAAAVQSNNPAASVTSIPIPEQPPDQPLSKLQKLIGAAAASSDFCFASSDVQVRQNRLDA
ncbi:MAG: hypothetical protein FWC60_01510, partial [Firmicutes bacterium]|nr:hypothetical protein [Bacillota bacterium]